MDVHSLCGYFLELLTDGGAELTSEFGAKRPRWIVPWSTEETVRARIWSALAIFEVVLAVAAYWAFAAYFGTFVPILVSALFAPLLLLRSDQSVALGVKWFRAYTSRAGEFTDAELGVIIRSRWFWAAALADLAAANACGLVARGRLAHKLFRVAADTAKRHRWVLESSARNRCGRRGRLWRRGDYRGSWRGLGG